MSPTAVHWSHMFTARRSGHSMTWGVELYHMRHAFRNRVIKLRPREAGLLDQEGEVASEDVAGLSEQLSGLSGN